jgi:hypothetical protein
MNSSEGFEKFLFLSKYQITQSESDRPRAAGNSRVALTWKLGERSRHHLIAMPNSGVGIGRSLYPCFVSTGCLILFRPVQHHHGDIFSVCSRSTVLALGALSPSRPSCPHCQQSSFCSPRIGCVRFDSDTGNISYYHGTPHSDRERAI